MPFTLTRGEYGQVFTMGVTGLVAGILYQLGVVFFKQSSDEYQLDPNTESLQNHSTLHNLYYQLADYRKFSNSNYRKAVLAADELAVRLYQIEAQNITPTIDDANDAFGMLQDAKNSLTRLRRAAQTKGNDQRSAAMIHRLNELIYPELQSLYTAILRKSNQ